jgi:hypothetical protein
MEATCPLTNPVVFFFQNPSLQKSTLLVPAEVQVMTASLALLATSVQASHVSASFAVFFQKPMLHEPVEMRLVVEEVQVTIALLPLFETSTHGVVQLAWPGNSLYMVLGHT